MHNACPSSTLLSAEEDELCDDVRGSFDDQISSLSRRFLYTPSLFSSLAKTMLFFAFDFQRYTGRSSYWTIVLKIETPQSRRRVFGTCSRATTCSVTD